MTGRPRTSTLPRYKSCANCEVTFDRYGGKKVRSDEQWAAQRYCSQRCYHEHRKVLSADSMPWIESATGCWVWQQRINKAGYGVVVRDDRHQPAHRWVYEQFVGPIPEGLHLDHLCHTQDPACPGGVACEHRRCVNPGHLEPVTIVENNQRMGERLTHCKRGHEFTPENTEVSRTTGRRRCRACHRLWYEDQRAA